MTERARAEGHWIGNDTWSHRRPFGQTDDQAATAREIERTQALIGDLARPDRLFRPMRAGGHLDARLFSPAALRTLRTGATRSCCGTRYRATWVDPHGWVPRAL